MHWEQKKKKGHFSSQLKAKSTSWSRAELRQKYKKIKSQTHSDMKNQNEVRVTDPHLLPTSPLILSISITTIRYSRSIANPSAYQVEH